MSLKPTKGSVRKLRKATEECSPQRPSSILDAINADSFGRGLSDGSTSSTSSMPYSDRSKSLSNHQLRTYVYDGSF
jgi:hypothetical protein